MELIPKIGEGTPLPHFLCLSGCEVSGPETFPCVADIFLQGTKLTSKQGVLLPPQLRNPWEQGVPGSFPSGHLQERTTETDLERSELHKGIEGFYNTGDLQLQLAEAGRAEQ